MILNNTPIMTKQERIERCIYRLENMLLAGSIEKAVLEKEADQILSEMCFLLEQAPEKVDFFNNQMQRIILDMVDLSLIKSEITKRINVIKGLNTDAIEKSREIIKRFDYLETVLKENKEIILAKGEKNYV